MRYSAITVALLGILSSMPAYADNIEVEDALQRRADLSNFYQAMINTGVSHELSPDATYTVFAPTNSAFAAIPQDRYPCFYTVECRAQVAAILRNHIAHGEIYISDAARQTGGYYSINGRFVNVGEPNRNTYAVDGNNIVYTSAFGGGILYKINGVIANPRELASVQYPQYAYAPEQVTTVTERTIPDPACGPAGCADAATKTTTVTRTVITPVLTEPAR